MKIYPYNHYSKNVSHLLDECIQSAKEHRFDIHYVIVDDESYFEEILLKKTSYLFNIEIVSLSHFFQKIMNNHHQSFQLKTVYENIIEIFELNQKNQDSLFHQTMNPFQNAKSILEVFKNFYLYEIEEKDVDLPTLSKKKIKTLFSLYNQFDKKHLFHHDFIESIINEKDCHYYYFVLSHLDKKTEKIIQKLDQFGHVVIYQPTLMQAIDDYSDCTINHLFDSVQEKKIIENPYEILKANTIQEEIKQVVYDIFMSLKQNHYHDFVIYYPNDDYYRHLSRILEQFEIPYNKHSQVQSQLFQTLKTMLEYVMENDDQLLFDLLSTFQFKSFQDIKYISLLKKQYMSQKVIDDKGLLDFKQQLQVLKKQDTITHISQYLIEIIENVFVENEDVYTLISFLKDLKSENTVTIKEYIQLCDCLFSKKTIYEKTKIDSLTLFTYQQPYSELLQAKTIYCLGLNETVIPQDMKNTQIILNEEAKAIGYPGAFKQLQLHYQQLQNVFSNRHERIVLSYALRDLKGNELVVSSIIKKIKNLFDVKTFHKHQLLHSFLKSDYYLLGGYDDHLEAFNQSINNYKVMKHQCFPLQEKVNYNPLSASKLEVYNQCPYKYFNQYLLNISDTKNDKLQANEIGTFVHYILEKNRRYFMNNHPSSFTHLKEDIQKTVDDYFNKNFQPKFLLPQNQFFIKLIQDDLYNTIIVLSKQMEKGLFTLQCCEKKVYDKKEDIELKGFIDRVDQYEDYIKVIDYKSSQKNLNLDLARLGFKIQMLLYLEMLCKDKQLKKGAVLYFNTKKRLLKSDISILEKQSAQNYFQLYQMDGYTVEDVYPMIDTEIETESSIIKVKLKKDQTPNKYSKVISSQDLDFLLHDIEKHIEKLYDAMNEGDIRIYPTRSESGNIDMQVNPCSFCDYRALCNFDVFYNEKHMISTGGQNEER